MEGTLATGRLHPHQLRQGVCSPVSWLVQGKVRVSWGGRLGGGRCRSLRSLDAMSDFYRKQLGRENSVISVAKGQTPWNSSLHYWDSVGLRKGNPKISPSLCCCVARAFFAQGVKESIGSMSVFVSPFYWWLSPSHLSDSQLGQEGYFWSLIEDHAAKDFSVHIYRAEGRDGKHLGPAKSQKPLDEQVKVFTHPYLVRWAVGTWCWMSRFC